MSEITTKIMDTPGDKLGCFFAMGPKRAEAVLYGTKDVSAESWAEMTDNAKMIEVYIDGVPMATAWFDTFYGKTANMHFCYYDGSDKFIDIIAKTTHKWAFTILELSGIFGITPKPYRAIFSRLLEPNKFIRIAEIKDMCYMRKYKKHVPGIITYLSYERWKEYAQI